MEVQNGDFGTGAGSKRRGGDSFLFEEQHTISRDI